MRKIHKGTTTKAASFSKSSVSLDITPILDQSPLYLKVKIFSKWKKAESTSFRSKKFLKITKESIPSIDESQTEHCHNRASKNWVGHSQWENVFLLSRCWFLRQISLASQCDSNFSAICLQKWIRCHAVKDKALFCDQHFLSSVPLLSMLTHLPFDIVYLISAK